MKKSIILSQNFNQPEVEITKFTKLEKADVDFLAHAPTTPTQVSPEVLVQDILEKKHTGRVTVVVHLDLEDRPLMFTTSKFHTQAVRKKEVKANDLSGTIKITLWDDAIDEVGNNNGTFKLYT